MSRIAPLDDKQLSTDMAALMAEARHFMGFTPNDGLIMARMPRLAKAVNDMVAAIYHPQGKLSAELKRLVALIVSTAAGCRYCASHVAFGAASHGTRQAKLDAVWTYPTSDLFNEAERAALRLAQESAFTPPHVTDETFAALKDHFSDDEITELVGTIALFAFLNKWNSILATEIEDDPQAYINQNPIQTQSGEEKQHNKGANNNA